MGNVKWRGEHKAYSVSLMSKSISILQNWTFILDTIQLRMFFYVK